MNIITMREEPKKPVHTFEAICESRACENLLVDKGKIDINVIDVEKIFEVGKTYRVTIEKVEQCH